MKKMKRAVSLLLLAAMLLTLCSCGSRDGNGRDRDSTEATEEDAAPAETTAAVSTGGWMDDPTILAHVENNRNAGIIPDLDREAERFDLYVDNIKTFNGFVTHSMSNYQLGIQSVVDVASYMFPENLYGHAMVDSAAETDASKASLTWEEVALDKYFTRDLRTESFYKVRLNPEFGTMDRLFMDDEPFKENGLTAIVTNFMGDYFDMSAVYNGIQRYFDRYPHSAAVVMGFTSTFKGPTTSDGTFLILPDSSNSAKGEFSIKNFNGELPVYMIVVGPEQAVKDYQNRLAKSLEDQNVEVGMSCYSNSVYEYLQERPLNFRVISDPSSVKKVTSIQEQFWFFDSDGSSGSVKEWNLGRHWGSFNVGDITVNDTGTVVISVNRGSTTQADRSAVRSRGDQDGIPMNTSKYGRTSLARQLTLFSTDYNNRSLYTAEYQLYVFDDKVGEWTACSKSETSMLLFGFGKQEGPVDDYRSSFQAEKITILPQDNTEFCLSARLNYDSSADSVLNQDKTYRLEVIIRLNRPNPRAESSATPNELSRFFTTETEFYGYKKYIVGTDHNNWGAEGMKGANQNAAKSRLMTTPKLDLLLDNLDKLEKRFDVDVPVVEYLDIIFETGKPDSRR